MTTTSDAISAYEANAAEHGRATEEGNSEVANAAHDRLMDALKVLIENDARGELLTLLDREDTSVRCWAATHTLPVDAERATAVLREVSEGASFVAFNAATVLSEWEKGTLSVP